MAPKKRTPAYNPFGKGGESDDQPVIAPTIDEVDQSLYGKIDLSGAGQKPVKKIPLGQIIPDPAQPRRSVPKDVAREARAANVPLWQAWHRMAGRLAGKPIDLKAMLQGGGEAPEANPLDIALVDDFMALVGLAASIYRDGLINPISIFSVGPNRYQIESGEGRWLAHSMLRAVLEEEKWNQIDALIVAKADVWRQAAENGARRPLNAISMARQLALLIMDLWRGRDGASFVPYGQMVQEEDVDRKFYAQVADGNIWRIPKGQSERILQVTGFKSKSQLQQYRALLSIPDDLWSKADEGNWPEGRIREMIRPPAPSQDRSTTVDLSPQNGGRFHTVQEENLPTGLPIPPRPPALLNATGGPLRWPLEGDGARYMYMWPGGERVQLESAETIKGVLSARGWHLDENGKRTHAFYTPMSNLKEEPPAATKPAPLKIVVGQTYKHRFGSRLYEVVGLAGDSVSCYEVNLAGKRITPSPFQMNIENLAEIERPAQTDSDLMGKRVFHHLGAYRYEGVVIEVKWDHSVGDHLVKIRADDGKTDGPFLAKNVRVIATSIDDGMTADQAFEAAIESDAPAATDFAFGDKVRVKGAGRDGQIWAVTSVDGDFLSLQLQNGKPGETGIIPMILTRQVEKIDDTVPTMKPLPAWAQPGRMVRDVSTDETGKVKSARWSATANDWYLIVQFLDTTGEVPLAMLEANDPVPVLPEWVQVGHLIRHKESGKVCQVISAGFNVSEDAWMLHVDVYKEGIADAPLHEFEPMGQSEEIAIVQGVTAAPRERHPALHPANMSGVIVQEQHFMGVLGDMARRLEMHQSADLIMGLQVLSAKGIKTRLKDATPDQAYAWLDMLRAGAVAVLEQMAAHIDTIHANACQIIDDIDAEQRGQS